MILSCDTSELKAALATAGRVIPARHPIQIFTAVKLVTNDNRVTIIGTDSDKSIELDVAANVETEGVAILPFSALVTFVRSAKSEITKIVVDDGTAKISASRARIILSVWPPEDYPHYTAVEVDPVEIDGPTFARALRFCNAAAATDDAKWDMRGVLVRDHGGHVEMWATDGGSAHHAKLPELPTIGGGGVFPSEAIDAILPVADRADTVSVAITDRGWQIAARGTRLWGKVVDGSFPDMHRMAAQFDEWEEVATAEYTDLASALGVASCGTEQDSGKSRNLVIRADVGGPILMRGHKPQGGVVEAGTAEVPVEAKASFAGVVSGKYFSAAVNMGADHVTLMWCGREDARQAVRVVEAQPSATLELSSLMMTMRVPEGQLEITAEAA